MRSQLLFAVLVLLTLLPAAGTLAEQAPASDPKVPEFARLPDLATLRSLQLGPETTDAMLVYVKDLQKLRDLAMQETKVTDDGLKNLAGLVHLEKLNLTNTQVSDAGLMHLQRLTALKRLRLAHSRVSGAGLAAWGPYENWSFSISAACANLRR